MFNIKNIRSSMIALGLLSGTYVSLQAAGIFIEAESFSDKGGWVVDQQFKEAAFCPTCLPPLI